MKRILECSSAGDARFSAFYAVVEINGVTATIEEHYQLSKRFWDVANNKLFIPKKISDAKGRPPKYFVAYGLPYPPDKLTAWYTYLWLEYLEANPMLVNVLSHYDDYSDKFKTSSTINCQADVIRRYMHEGRDVLLDEYGDFYKCFRPFMSQMTEVYERA